MQSRLGGAGLLTLALVLAGCSGGGSPPPYYPPPAPAEVSMGANSWLFQYSNGMPPSPTAAAVGWEFTFPDCGGTSACSVNYLTTASPVLIAGNTMRARIGTNGATSDKFIYKLKADNTCDNPATTRFFIQLAGDNLQNEFGRWWATNGFVLGSAASFNLSTALLPENWSSVYGKRGDSSDTARQAFAAALANAGRIGFTFGGGCFYGHGVNVLGTATFKAESYTTK